MRQDTLCTTAAALNYDVMAMGVTILVIETWRFVPAACFALSSILFSAQVFIDAEKETGDGENT